MLKLYNVNCFKSCSSLQTNHKLQCKCFSRIRVVHSNNDILVESIHIFFQLQYATLFCKRQAVKDSLYDNFKQYTRTIAKSYSKGYRVNFILCTIKTQFEFLMAPSQAKLDLNSSTVSPRRCALFHFWEHTL